MGYDEYKLDSGRESYGDPPTVMVECLTCHAERRIPSSEYGQHSNVCPACIEADIQRVMRLTAERIKRTA